MLSPREMIDDRPDDNVFRVNRAAFTDAIAEVPADADPIFTMTVTDDLLVRSVASAED